MKILVTAFEPFGGSAVNASEHALRLIKPHSLPGASLYTALLPVDQKAPHLLCERLEEISPQAVVCLGEAARRPALSFERVAVNLLDYRIPDNQGRQVQDEPVIAGAPAAYFSTLPLREMLVAAKAAGVPAELSLSAGAFLCNQVFYTLLHHLSERNPAVKAGFIHLPILPEAAASSDLPLPSLPAEISLKGVLAALVCLLHLE